MNYFVLLILLLVLIWQKINYLQVLLNQQKQKSGGECK